MRIFTLFFLPIYLSSQQIDVKLNWQGTEQLYVGLEPVKIPKAIGQTIFYDEENERFVISIKKKLAYNKNLQYYIKNVQTQEIRSDMEVDLDLNKLTPRPNIMVYNTIGRDDHQVVFQIEPFIFKNDKLHTVTRLTISSRAVEQSQLQRAKRVESINSMPPESGFRFEVNKTGIHKIPASFLRDLGMPISSINPKTLKIFGKGGKMLSIINSGAGGVNYGFSENPLKLVGMDDGRIDDEDYILFYAYGPNEWNDESQTAVNLYHDKAH